MASYSQTKKGNKVGLTTFNNWGKGNVIGFKTEVIDGKTSRGGTNRWIFC